MRDAMVVASYGTGVADTYERIKHNVMLYGLPGQTAGTATVAAGAGGAASSEESVAAVAASSSPRVGIKGPHGPCNRPGCDKVGPRLKCTLCNGLKGGRYCSELCQKSDWRAHKKLCTLRVPVAEEVRLST